MCETQLGGEVRSGMKVLSSILTNIACFDICNWLSLAAWSHYMCVSNLGQAV